MVVVAIIAVLATLVAPKLLGNIIKSKINVAEAGVRSIAQQVGIYMADNGMGRLPDDFELEMLTEGDRPLLNAKDLVDPWDNDYVLINPGETNIDFDVVSYGADGQSGGDGDDADIVN